MLAVDDGAPTQNVSSASAQIEFVRGKYLSLEGVDMGGSPFKALWTPNKAFIESLRPSETKNEKFKWGERGEVFRTDYQNEPNYSAIDGMVAGLTGFTGSVGSLLPAALQNGIWSSPFPGPKSQLELLPARNLGNDACYVIQATSPELNRVKTYTIERKNVFAAPHDRRFGRANL